MRRSVRITTALTVATTCAVFQARVSAEQRQGSRPASPDRYVILGCVSRGPATARGTSTYLVTDTRGEKPAVYRVDGDTATLDFHVGHLVEIAGPLTAPAPGGASAAGRALVMKVERLSYISKDCPAAKR